MGRGIRNEKNKSENFIYIRLLYFCYCICKIEVTRLENNLYKTNDGFYIETKFCYEYANREEAILSYEQYSYDNKLIFKNGQNCEVKRVSR